MLILTTVNTGREGEYQPAYLLVHLVEILEWFVSELCWCDCLDHLVHRCHVGTPLMAAFHPHTRGARITASIEAADSAQHLGMFGRPAPDTVSRFKAVCSDGNTQFFIFFSTWSGCGDNLGEPWFAWHAIWPKTIRSPLVCHFVVLSAISWSLVSYHYQLSFSYLSAISWLHFSFQLVTCQL